VIFVAMLLRSARLPDGGGSGISFEPTQDITQSIRQSIAPENTAENTSTEQAVRNDFKLFYYYNEARLGRYLAFSAANPDLETSDVVWMVDCDLDEAPYENTHDIANPFSTQAIVNKHFSLLPEYVPDDLTTVGATQMRAVPAAALEELMSDAAAQGLQIWATSGFRSYETQAAFYDGYVARDGEAQASSYSARAGFSEHQTGLAVDINNVEEPPPAETAWLSQHAHEYGFITRYTSENERITGYISEPWHLRYIGVSDATNMYNLEISSYEEYWVKYILYTLTEAL
jgi:D-alanyl-D-alanine carboxypeptidase